MKRLLVILALACALPSAAQVPATCPVPTLHCWNLVGTIPSLPDGVVRPGVDFVTTTFISDETSITWGVKTIWYPNIGDPLGYPGGGTAMFVVEMQNGQWTITSAIDYDVNDAKITAAGGPAAYIASVVKPAVDAWKAQRFAQPQTQQPVVAVSLLLPVLLSE